MKTNTARTILVILLATLGTFLGASCRTFRGFGQDVQHAGSHIEHAGRHH
jgi:predicted small secreted protein